MADAKEKSKSFQDYQLSYARSLSKIRNHLETKIESILSPVHFDAAMRTYSGYLSTELPQVMWVKFFQDQTPDDQSTKENGQANESTSDGDQSIKSGKGADQGQLSIDQLLIDELIVVCQTLPPLKTKFSQEEKQTLEQLQNIFNDIRVAILLNSAVNDENENQYRSIESNLLTVLTDFGINVDLSENAKGDKLDKNLFECSPLCYDQILKKIDNLIASDDDNLYNKHDRAELVKVISSARKQKQKDSNSEHLSVLQKPLTSSIQQALQCGYCQRIVKDAKTLPCLHVCCGSCLKSNFADNNSIHATSGSSSQSISDKQAITCPMCHTRISMPSVAHVDQLPRGFVPETLIKVHESMSNLKKDKTSIECCLCINAPLYICLLCTEFYCQNHVANFYKHGDTSDNEARPSHADTIVPLSALITADNASSWLYRFCPQHRQRLTHFCSGCRVPLCSHMLCVDWHSQHVDPTPGLRPIDQVIQDERQRLTGMENLLCKKAEKIRSKIDLVEKNQITVADVQENVRQSIEKYFADIEEKLAKNKIAFLADLDKSAAQCFQNDETIHSRLLAWSEKTEKIESLFRLYLENRSDSTTTSKTANSSASVPELASLRYRILQQLSDSCSGGLVSSTKRLSYPETRLRELQHQIGTLQSNIVTASAGRGWESVIKFTTGMTPNVVGSPVHFVIDNQRNLIYVIKSRGYVATGQVLSYDLKQLENRTPHPICDAGARSFESLAVDPANRRLFVAEQPQNLLELPTMKFKKYAPVRLYDFNTLGVSTLKRTLSLDHLKTFSKSIIKYASDRLYICDGVCVCEYDAAEEFKLMRKFNFHNMLEIADFAVESKRDFFYVVDSKKHCLLIFNCRDQVVKLIGEQGVTPGRFDQPCSVVLDDFGHVFVADAGNFRVQIFDLDGKFLRFIQYPQLIKEIAQAPAMVSDQKTGAVSTLVKVALQVADDYLYMCDSRLEQLWRYRYI